MAAHKTSNILIFGATGTIGQHITSAILQHRSSFDRIAIFTSAATLSNKPSRIAALRSAGVTILIGDIESASDVKAAYSGYDTVVSCVGRPVIALQTHLIALADAHPDVRRFFPSEYGTDIEHGPQSATEKPHQQKLRVRAQLRNETKDLEYTFVVTGPYGDGESHLYLSALPPGQDRVGSFDVKAKRAVLLGDGNGKISLTTMRDVGKLVVGALLHPDQVRNRAVCVNSFTATPREIVAAFERLRGGEKWEVECVGLDEVRKVEAKAWEEGSPAAGVYTLRRIWAEGGTLYEKRDNDLIGVEEGLDSLDSAVQQAIEVQLSSK